MEVPVSSSYRTRLAPTPTGFLHLGHAKTFGLAHSRARAAGGKVLLRVEDLDRARCKPEYVDAVLADFEWMGVDWDEGPVFQSERRRVYEGGWQHLKEVGAIYPCAVTRKELRNVALAPHEDEEAAEPIFPAALRGRVEDGLSADAPGGTAWRFKVPDGRVICFDDALAGPQSFEAGTDFGDFVVWRRDDVPAYELAVVADDLAQSVTEVVRGRDLLRSTARQILLIEALGGESPAWVHAPLVCDREGRRLAKRHGSLAMKTLREAGWDYADAVAAHEAGELE